MNGIKSIIDKPDAIPICNSSNPPIPLTKILEMIPILEKIKSVINRK